jgi:threonine dehydrogenase-like Zn-dependent dehydrogenase
VGSGVLLGGVPGVLPGKVLILGGGVVGTNAAKVAAGLGARVGIMDIDLERLRYLDDVMPANVTHALQHALRDPQAGRGRGPDHRSGAHSGREGAEPHHEGRPVAHARRAR